MIANVKTLYTTAARAIGGRNGQASTLDGALSVPLSLPKELGGAGGPGNNPEQLFAAGYSACFLTGMKTIARELALPLSDDATVTTTIGIGPRAEGGFGLTAALAIRAAGIDRATAEDLVKRTDAVCPYSNSIRGNVAVMFSLE